MTAQGAVISPVARRAWVLIPMIAALVVAACQARSATELLQVSALSPAEVQVGEDVHVVGDGFALGSAATVTLRGVLHQAGRPGRNVEVSFPARTESQRELSVTLAREAEAELCGSPHESSHATFRGDVQVAIAAKARGGPPVTGTLHGAVLELYPSTRARSAEEQQIAEGQRALAFFGLEVASEGPGLAIVRLAPGSRAVAADLRPGDRIVRAGGVSVLSPSDLVPAAARTLELGVVRGASELSVLLDVDGFAPRPPESVSRAAVPVLAVAFGLVFWASPLFAASSWMANNWLEQRRAAQRRRGAQPDLASRVARHWASMLIWLGVGAAVLSPVLRTDPVDLPLGLVALMFAASTLLLMAALLRGGSAPGTWLLGAGVRAACRQTVVVAPAWVALFAGWGDPGPARGLVDLPSWCGSSTALGNPGLLLGLIVMLSSAVPLPAGSGSAGLQHARSVGARASPAPPDWLCTLYSCAVCAVAASAFLGAELPFGASPSSRAASLGVALLAFVEYTALVICVTWLRRSCLNISADQWVPIAGFVLLPASVLAALLAYGFRGLGSLPPLWQWLGSMYGPAGALALVAAGAVSVWRIAAARRRPAPASLTPWS